jgi:hypothetical protein
VAPETEQESLKRLEQIVLPSGILTSRLDNKNGVIVDINARLFYDIEIGDLVTLELLEDVHIAENKRTVTDLEHTMLTGSIRNKGRFQMYHEICDFYEMVRGDYICYKVHSIKRKSAKKDKPYEVDTSDHEVDWIC